MPKTLSRFVLLVAVLPACDSKQPDTAPASLTTTALTATPTVTATPTATTTNSQVVAHIRVAIRKVSIGKVPLAADGSITFADEPRLMIALRIEHVGDKKRSEYHTWVPDLEAARTVARLTDDRGAELKRVTFGFGNNVKDRTVLDTLTPGKVIGDLLVFETPAANAKALKLVLPGANCGVKGAFEFDIDMATVVRPK